MHPENKTEELLEYISKKDSLTVEQKKQEIEKFAHPDKNSNYNAGQACATCPPSHARKEFVDELINSLESRYAVTIYTAYPGTPLNDNDGKPEFKEGKRVVSEAGHMWLEISKIQKNNINTSKSYGFAPKKSGITGAGSVTDKDTHHYENPYYRRKIEIKKDQYNRLKEFGDTATKESEKYFDLYYNGATNSCIDFTWQALRHAGLIPESTWNDFSRYNKEKKKAGKFDGDLKVINNIPHIKSIPTPFPDSELNSEKYNQKPDRTMLQWILSKNDDDKNGDSVEVANRKHDSAPNHV
ncbi:MULTISPECIES: hypothetical protein [Pectobacterium]|uniref:hypothetical protein n=1 Tax=Pectobacterium TaxID=122277 RepID=UPI00102E6E04|nr:MULTISPECIES: hypothetical protein [Pectobacterium]MBA0168740.1 hypothetical protein [Pectobacterium sp. CFBP8739]MBQ4778902.1 hypothetical protein [Pectobacterium versatile]MBQ4786625.1 hypothetical protein [Pectobacterium versatile]MCA5931727.1 hypothetical protein [Pectobacterium versatile]MCA5948985.1 hypothetical protein [Pectobacterium versatile]